MAVVVVTRSAELVSSGFGSQTMSEGRAEATQVIVYETPQAQPQSYTSTTSNVPGGANQAGLQAGWIVAIVALILLAMSLTFILLKWWLDRRRSRSMSGRGTNFRPQSEYYEITKPPRSRRRSSVFARYSGRY